MLRLLVEIEFYEIGLEFGIIFEYQVLCLPSFAMVASQTIKRLRFLIEISG